MDFCERCLMRHHIGHELKSSKCERGITCTSEWRGKAEKESMSNGSVPAQFISQRTGLMFVYVHVNVHGSCLLPTYALSNVKCRLSMPVSLFVCGCVFVSVCLCLCMVLRLCDDVYTKVYALWTNI